MDGLTGDLLPKHIKRISFIKMFESSRIRVLSGITSQKSEIFLPQHLFPLLRASQLPRIRYIKSFRDGTKRSTNFVEKNKPCEATIIQKGYLSYRRETTKKVLDFNY